MRFSQKLKIIVRILTVPSRSQICGYLKSCSTFLKWNDRSSMIFENLIVNLLFVLDLLTHLFAIVLWVQKQMVNSHYYYTNQN